MNDKFLSDPRFAGIQPFEDKQWLSSPTMHGEELAYVTEAIETNWVSTLGENINVLEKMIAEKLGMRCCVALGCGTAALHLSTKLAAERCYPDTRHGNALLGKKVFASDMTFDASVNPVLYEGGEAVFIDTEPDTWNMDPESLEKAFERYPDVKIVVLAHLYGVPAKMDEIVSICRKHGAVIIEDAAEALGSTYKGSLVSGECGSFGDYVAISFNGNKVVTGSTGGAFVTNSREDAEKVRKWSTQSREPAPWYQHEELGYNYRMSNIVAGIARGNFLHIDEHIAQKKAIYERYKEGFKGLPVSMNPFEDKADPNCWLSCILIDEDAMCEESRGDLDYSYRTAPGKSCPQEILEALAAFNAEGRPIWKPMHLQPIYRNHPFVTRDGDGRREGSRDVGADIFRRGLCLPSDNKMTAENQAKVIEIVRRCFA
uniref:DegT/DnrJ/EryC1/StrS aminotransferase n=1 Tax=uncultured bacterium Contig248 TaxID=1393544 RepID=W0FNG7_9BACT|nr:DegT/DnrJ/EryC1/StrS aminotransferase [uncultured bacterium Contig248]